MRALALASQQRFLAELREFRREPAAVGFTMLFPVMLLLLFGSIFGGTVPGTDVEYRQVYVAGIIGSSLLSIGLVSIAIGIAAQRDAGMLKRLASTPMPRAAYFVGKAGLVLVLSLGQIAVMLTIGVVLFGLSLPTDPGRWLTFAWVLVLGSAAATVMGIAAGGIMPSAKAAPAILNVPFVGLQFISGVFIPFTQLPHWLYRLSGWLPLRWICQGMRSVFLPDSFRTVESGGSWQHGQVAVVLALWCALGAGVALRRFRWVGQER